MSRRNLDHSAASLENSIGGEEVQLCGEIVKHKAFGKGKIVAHESNYVTILFDVGNAEKKFVYPSAFGSFLELESNSFLKQIEADQNVIAEIEADKLKMKEDRDKLAIAFKAEEVEALRVKSTKKRAPAKPKIKKV